MRLNFQRTHGTRRGAPTAWIWFGTLVLWAQATLAQPGVDPAACWAASEPNTLALARSCKGHPGCAMVLVRQQACPAGKRFLDKLAIALGTSSRIDNNRVITAAMPELRDIVGLRSAVAQVEAQVQGILDQSPLHPGVAMRTRTGTALFYEGQISDNLPNGIGALISAGGTMTRGNFVNGVLFGSGQNLHSTGAVFVGSMQDGKIMGDGAVQLPDGMAMVGFFDDYRPNSLTEYFFPDGRSQKAFFSEPGKLRIAGPMAAPGQTAANPDMNIVMAALDLSLRCMGEAIAEFGDNPTEKVNKLREVVRGPCGADPGTVRKLAEAEKEAGVAASQDLERARQAAAAKTQADAERTAMFNNFLGQVSSMLGSYQAGQQMAAAEANSAAAAAAASRQPVQAAAATTSGAGRASEAPAREPAGRTRLVHNPAADARSCVRMVQSSASTTARISGNFSFQNACNSTVEVFWCFPRAGGGCGGAGTVSIGAGRGWPVLDNEASIIWSACRGANGGGFDRDVAPGTRYTCHLLQW